MNETPLYPYSVKEARARSELEQWRESFRANCACAGMVEIVIRENFDGMHLKDGAVEQVVSQFGYTRLEHVLANTVRELSYDKRFHPNNKEWANRHYVPKDEEHNAYPHIKLYRMTAFLKYCVINNMVIELDL